MLDRIAEAMAGTLDTPLIDILFGHGGISVDPTGHAQPALFAIGVGLAELYRSWGFAPAALPGHSVGEIAVACVAVAVSVQAPARPLAAPGRVLQGLTGGHL